jgi:hypothetical protein
VSGGGDGLVRKKWDGERRANGKGKEGKEKESSTF